MPIVDNMLYLSIYYIDSCMSDNIEYILMIVYICFRFVFVMYWINYSITPHTSCRLFPEQDTLCYEQDTLVTAVQPRSCICSSDHYACCGSLIVQPRDNVIHRNIIIAAQIRSSLSLHLRRTTSHSNRKRLRRKWSIQNLVANYRTLTRTIGQLFVIFLCIWAYCFAGFTTKF